jgi:hypothetical protein
MKIAAEIRRALPPDAEEISRVIVRALHETNGARNGDSALNLRPLSYVSKIV